MKNFFYSIIIVLLFSNLTQASTYNVGDRGTFSFSSLLYIGLGDESYQDNTWITFPFPTTIFKSDGESEVIPFLTEDDLFQIDLFENSNDLVPTFTQLIDGLDGSPTRLGFTRPMSVGLDGSTSFGNLLWEDFEGKVTLTMLSGSIDLDSLYVEISASGQTWGQSFEVSYIPTPIPGTAWLMVVALLSLASLKKKNQKASRKEQM